MELFRSMSGMVAVELTSADPAGALAALNGADIPIYNADAVDDIRVRFSVDRHRFRKVSEICQKRGETLRVIRRRGIYWTAKGLLKRPVLVLGGLLLGLMLLYLPSRVFFIRVEGNQTVPANLILEAAEGCGIRFGASRRQVRSERVKNALLEAVPELQWAGVNTSGCVATISVRERTLTDAQQEESYVSNITASRDGIILSCTATRGNLLCAPGQAVKAGEILISGYTDCGLVIRATGAEGEVFAQTVRDLTAVTPSEYLQKTETGVIKRCISLLIGKKRINLWKDSGIWDSTCGRIYTEYYVTLPGGFRLPLGFAVEEFTAATLKTTEDGQKEPELTEFADRCLKQQMVAGQILSRDLSFTAENGVYRLEGEYVCTEMIGRVQRETIGETHGENN